MHKHFKRTILTLFSACLLMAGFCTASFASVISPSETSVTLPKGTDTFSFDIILDADSSFAGAEFGLKPSSSDVKFEEITFSQELSGESQVKTVKDGILYFGFFASENKYEAGKHTVATVTYRYNGTADRSVRLAESKIVTVSEAGHTSHTVRRYRKSGRRLRRLRRQRRKWRRQRNRRQQL